jgi:hypothetical protein
MLNILVLWSEQGSVELIRGDNTTNKMCLHLQSHMEFSSRSVQQSRLLKINPPLLSRFLLSATVYFNTWTYYSNLQPDFQSKQLAVSEANELCLWDEYIRFK